MATKISRKHLAIFGLSFALLGSILLIKSFAANTSIALEPESATLNGAATAEPDSNASGGRYVRLGSSTSTNTNVNLPVRAAFYYPWFPETWTVNGSHVSYQPTLGYYDSSQQSVIDSHIQAMQYAGIKVGIFSWWGSGTHTESTRIPLIFQRTQALGSAIKWAAYYEPEGSGDPSVSQIQADLNYIKTNYTTSPSYAYVNGKPVIFVYNASVNDGTCALADKWAQANASIGFYVDLKVFSGYTSCANQPSSWHQYSPAVATDSQPNYSYSISPGFWRADEASARLARDPTRWVQNIASMKASNAPWQLVTTFNEWGEGTATESATNWSSTSTYGTYLDALHNNQ